MPQEKIGPESTMAVSDELDLPVGHIIETLGHQNFPRLRVGIGKDFPQGYQVDFVLGKFYSEERPLIDAAIERAVAGLLTFITMGIEKAMNETNQTVGN